MKSTPSNAALIARLAALRGIGESYDDYRGEPRRVSPATQAALLRAMGFDLRRASALEEAIAAAESHRWQSALPPVAVTGGARPAVDVNVLAATPPGAFDCSVTLEAAAVSRWRVHAHDCDEIARGVRAGREVSTRRLALPPDLPLGYHRLSLAADAAPIGAMPLIVAPERCHEPEQLLRGGRLWGIAVQLYTLRSAANWGMGDFADLEQVVRAAAARGAAFVGLNPLHASFPQRPAQCSPYSPSSRHALNVLYIAVERVPEFESCATARALVQSTAFRQRLEALRAPALVDYPGVAAAKLEVLDLLYRQFRDEHLAAGTARAAAFATWRVERGRNIELHAVFDALHEHLAVTGVATDGWQTWPRKYRDPGARAVAAFAAASAERVTFYAWLQWLADSQLAAVRELCTSLGMPLGLYGDYAVGVDPGGSETWSDQAVYRLGAGIGAPPDELALKGQDWGIPPQDPSELAARGYQPFVSLIRANMRHFGALRLDHVMALFRQWWVPQGLGATDGGYVHYPLADLVSIVALESVRNRCLVVGEDLGTVPPEVGRAMAAFGLYHYKVVLFEKNAHHFFAPGDYVRQAIATLTTHDLPTLRGWWEAADLELRDRLHLYPDEATRERVRTARAQDRECMIDALAAAGIRPRWPVERFEPAFAAAIHAFLARTSSALAVVQAEDLAAMLDPVNVPGTSTEYPNWRRKMLVDIDGLFDGPGPGAICAEFSGQRSA